MSVITTNGNQEPSPTTKTTRKRPDPPPQQQQPPSATTTTTTTTTVAIHHSTTIMTSARQDGTKRTKPLQATENILHVGASTASATTSTTEQSSASSSSSSSKGARTIEKHRTTTTTRKHVRFTDDPPTIQVYCYTNDENEDDTLSQHVRLSWYSSRDIKHFGRTMTNTMHNILRQQQQQQQQQPQTSAVAWTQALVDLYKQSPLTAPTTTTLDMSIPDEAVGLEMPLLLVLLGSEIVAREQALWHNMRAWQQPSHQDEDATTNGIAHACREHSRPAIRLAHVVALHHFSHCQEK